MPKSLQETVKAVLLENENAASLKPKSKSADAPKKLEGEVQDLGGPVVKNDDPTVPADKAAASAKKAKEPGPTPPVGAEPMKKLHEELADVEMTEELQKFIDEMVAEGLTEDEIIEVIKEAKADITEDSHKDEDSKEDEKDDEDDKEEDVKEEAKPEFSFEVDVSEDLKAMFDGADLTEDFKTKVTTIFEAAIKTNLAKYKAVLDEEYEKTIEEAVKVITEEMDAKVEKYMNHVAEEWLQENEVAVESSLRTELTEDFIAGLRNLFLENFIDVPEEKVDVVEEMGSKVADLEEKLNEEMKKNIELKDQINEQKKINIINSVVEGMVETQAEKIKSLAENTEYVNEEDFKAKLNVLVESYTSTKAPKKDTSLIVEVSENPEKSIVAESTNDPMDRYVRAIGKTLPN